MALDPYFGNRSSAGSELVRDRLGAAVRHVATTGRYLGVDDGTHAAAVLVPAAALERANLAPAASWGVREARADWGTVRHQAAHHGPQAITYRGQVLGALVDLPTGEALAQGVPLVDGEEIEVLGEVLVDGQPLAPGEYAVPPGVVLSVRTPDQET
ncbi:hypothetical protein [Streptomonospora nanhaiensis]|uniref:hypothetical protein n=1 Tax=Streptomonospora nanhaiensis TaxID=1323731 RepID=UPI001C390E39|nr:hypothetical protein [Streptomonospora nanhaiensis]MBV2367122.1 hypothetical protein [Streptomonospora nanhaiensis]